MTSPKLHIAPCGMNCSLCVAFQRPKRPCAGCRSESDSQPKHCRNCSIKNCDGRDESGSRFCDRCTRFPCSPLRSLDKRYRSRYAISLLENLQNIRERGWESFLEHELERWRCPRCGGLRCVHLDHCPTCRQESSSQLP